MGGLLILISMVTGTVAFLSLIRPRPRFWLPTRNRAAVVWVASFVLFAVGGSLLPVPTPETQPEESALRGGTDTEVASEATGVVADREEDPDAMNIGNNEQETPCIPRKLSEASMELVRLYDQLHAFKDDPEFIRLGFGQGGPYSAWLQAIQRYRDTNSGLDLLDELGFLPGELMMLGMNYLGEDLSESDLSTIEFFEGKIQAGLAFTRCEEIDPNWRGTIQASSEARRSFEAEAEAQILARESLLGRPLTDEELVDVEFEKLRGVLGAGEEYPGQRAQRAAVAESRSLTDRMRAFRDQRIPEHGAALARAVAAAGAAERGQGTYTAALAAAETYVTLAAVIEAEISALATELAAVEETAPAKVAAVAATARMGMEQALAQITPSLAVQRDLLETQRAMVAELSIDERSTPRSRVTLEMLGDARLAIKDSDGRIVEVGLGGQGEIGNRQRSIFLEVLRGTSVLHAKELGENAVRIVERSWSGVEAADYTIVVSRTGPPARSSHELDERIIVEGSQGRF